MNSALSQAKAEREEEDERIENHMQSNLGKLADDLSDLQKYSENSEKSIFNTIKTSVVEIKSQLDGEKHKRYENYYEKIMA